MHATYSKMCKSLCNHAEQCKGVVTASSLLLLCAARRPQNQSLPLREPAIAAPQAFSVLRESQAVRSRACCLQGKRLPAVLVLT